MYWETVIIDTNIRKKKVTKQKDGENICLINDKVL